MSVPQALSHSRIRRAARDFIVSLGSPFRGVYPTIEQARAAAPRSRTWGYDNQQAAEMYRESLQPRWGDYALIYWLSRIIDAGSELLDIGGNIGLGFYAFEKYLAYPPDFKWVVYDLPASIEAGRKFVKDRPRPNLEFTARLDDCPHPDIILASGALQYIDWSLADFLATLSPRPKHVLINKLPAYEGRPFVTLQDIGPCICAYRVFNCQEFIESIGASGYDLVDRWSIGDLHCAIPFHPSRNVNGYSGMYFKLVEPISAPTPRARRAVSSNVPVLMPTRPEKLTVTRIGNSLQSTWPRNGQSAIALKFSRFRGNCTGPKSDGLASGHTRRRVRRRISFRAVPNGRSENG